MSSALVLAMALGAGPRLYTFRDSPSVGTPWALVVAGGSWRQRVSLPDLVFVLERPEGLTLVDAGYGTRFGEYRRRFPQSLFYAVAHVAWGPPRAPLPEQLARAGLDPARVRRILATHAHFDHVGGTLDFPGVPVVMTRPEGAYFQRTAPAFLKAALAPRLRLVDLESAPPFGVFRHGRDLFGDASVRLLDMHGHTPGHMGVLVRLGSGRRVLLAGDTAWVRENYARMRPRGWPARRLVDAGSNEEALRALHHLSQLDPGLMIVPSHDPLAERALPLPPAALD